MHPPISQGNAKYPPQGYPMNISTRQPYPPYTSSATAYAARWSTGLCHCCDDPANCLVTCMCPCVTFGQIAEVVNQGSISCAASGAVYGLLLGFTGLSCLYSCFYRSRLRGQCWNLGENSENFVKNKHCRDSYGRTLKISRKTVTVEIKNWEWIFPEKELLRI